MVGSCALRGIGTAQSSVRGYEMLLKAAEQGHRTAQFQLGSMFAVKRKEEIPPFDLAPAVK